MTLFNLPPELLCQILEYNRVKDLGILTATSPHLEPFVVHECQRRLKTLNREHAQIPPKRLLISQGYATEKNVLKDFLDQGHITYLEYRMYRHTLHDNRDRDTAITDVEEFEIKDDTKRLKQIKRVATNKFCAFRRKLARLAFVTKKRTRRGHGWTRKKQHKKTQTAV